MIWNPDAWDYTSKQILYDYRTGKILSIEQAKKIPEFVCMRYEIKGCWVLTIEEAKQWLTGRTV